MNRYPHVFSPGRIGPLATKNRIKYAATETNFNTSDGYVTDREVAYMEAQAKGGAGIVTTQGAYTDIKGEGKGFRGMMSIAEDRFIPGLARIAQVISDNGALSCLQILHCGREGGVDLNYSVMPSVVPQRLSYFKPPRELTLAEIKQSIREHVEAARRAVQAGYDMLEISGIVGYLISTFISRYTNKRQDEYGGETIQDRCKLMVEVIQAIKAEVGPSIPLGIRLCGSELLDDRGGNTLEESIESFAIAEQAGADYLSVTIGWHESSISVITRDVPMGHWLWVAKRVKDVVNVPVMMAFRQFLPHIPEKALAEGQIDFWEACRPMIADPDIPIKAAEGREAEIIPCIACNICFSRLYYHQPIMCSVRPSLGYEGDGKWGYHGFSPASRQKRVAVVGAGPAGLQFAAVAAQKGHSVTVWERSDKVGGALHMASKVDAGAGELLRTVGYLKGECDRRGVRFQMKSTPSPDELAGLRLDLLAVATGAETRVLPALASGSVLLTPFDIMMKGAMPGRRVAVVGGDGVGLGLAVHLLGKGEFEITVIEPSNRLGRDVSPFYMWQYMGLFRQRKVNLLKGYSISALRQGLLALSGRDQKEIEVDTVVIALRSAATGWDTTPGVLAKEVLILGDAKKPRRLLNAIHDGYRIAMEVL
jgi:2,4-dienoyl-CoA reductase (NADPH2)